MSAARRAGVSADGHFPAFIVEHKASDQQWTAGRRKWSLPHGLADFVYPSGLFLEMAALLAPCSLKRRYWGNMRPAWRINHTGFRSVCSPRAARNSMSFIKIFTLGHKVTHLPFVRRTTNVFLHVIVLSNLFPVLSFFPNLD